MSGLTQAEFARRSNCSQTTVSNALRAGRLALLPGGGIDAAFLKKQWRVNPKLGNRAKQSSDGTAMPAKKVGRPMAKPADAKRAKADVERTTNLLNATLEKEQSLAALRRLEYEQRAGVLINIDIARTVLFDQGRKAREHWLNWPVRIAPMLAAMLCAEPDDVLRALTKLVHEHVSAMGEPDGSDIRSRED